VNFALTVEDAEFLHDLNITVDEEVRSNLRFGVWRVVEFAHVKRRHEYWFCVCNCGAERTVSVNQLASNDSLTCHHTLPLPWINHRRVAVIFRGPMRIYQSCENEELALEWIRNNRQPSDTFEIRSEGNGQ
jgi:hypothetical protein